MGDMMPKDRDHDSRRRVTWALSLTGPALLLLVYAAAGPSPGSPALTFGQAVALLTVAVAGVTDAAWGKIYNASTYPAVAWGLGLALAGSAKPAALPLGALGTGDAFAGLAACLAVMLVVRDLTGCGMGDVKLGAALGCLLGAGVAFQALLLGFALAGLSAVAVAFARHGPVVVVVALAKGYLGVVLPAGVRPSLSEPERTLLGHRVRLGPYLAAGTVLAIAGGGASPFRM